MGASLKLWPPGISQSLARAYSASTSSLKLQFKCFFQCLEISASGKQILVVTLWIFLSL